MISPPSPSFRGGHCSTSVYCIDAVINVTSLLVSMIESSHVSQLNMAITLIITFLYHESSGGEFIMVIRANCKAIKHH